MVLRMTERLTIWRWLAPIMWNFGRRETLPVKDAYPVGRHDAGFMS
jgi:hypothetical protein